MHSTIADLQSGRLDVDKESNTLKSQLDLMLSVYHAREQKYTAAVESLEANHEAIIKDAEEKAGTIVAAAELKAADSTSIAAMRIAEMVQRAVKESDELRETALQEKEEWEAEKASVADIQTFQPIVKLSVGGEKFTTSLTTLTRFPDTMLGAMFSGRHALVLDEEGYHFIDRDGTHFRYILNFLRSPESFSTELTGAALKELKSECEYYGLSALMFSFVPIATFTVANRYNYSVNVEQDMNGIFNVNGQPVRICSTCGYGAHAPHYGNYAIKGFKNTVAGKGGVVRDSQPRTQANMCQMCGS